MKTVWIAVMAIAASASASAQSTIYKHVDDSGRITYSNKPMKGATVLELDPITILPGAPAAPTQKTAAIIDQRTPTLERANFVIDKPEAKPIAAIITPLPRTALASV